MSTYPSDVAFTPAVKRLQEVHGSREGYASMEADGGWQTQVTPGLEAFLAERDMFYLATSTADGQPYIQYRGGAPGFLKVLDEQTLAFADFRGNRQFISTGNLSENRKAFLFLMDYEHRRRIKIWGEAETSDDPALIEQLTDSDHRAGRPERAIVFRITAWDSNCPQHIHRRLPAQAVEEELERLRARVAELEAQLDGEGCR